MTNDNSLIAILSTLFKWKKSIVVSVTIIGAITAVVLFMKPDYYKSETVFYAANPDLADPSPLGYSDKKAYVYGQSEDRDRLFSILTSEETINYLISKFDLYNHYGKDSTNSNGRHLMKLAFKDNYSVSKSKYDAIVVGVEDTDPKLAADIANHARDYADLCAQNLLKKAQGVSMTANQENIVIQEKITTHLSDSMKVLKSKFNLIEPAYQARALADEIVKSQGGLAEAKAKANYYSKYESKQDSFMKYQANTAGLSHKLKELDNKLSSFNKGVNELKKMEQEYARAADQISIMKEKDKLVSSSYKNKFIATHVVDRALPADYKSRPKRSLLILASMLIASLAAVSGVLLIESFKKLNI